MTPIELGLAPLVVAGAGIMGSGIAQVAAQSGHPVKLFDARAGAAAAAKTKIAAGFDALVRKERLSVADAGAALARIEPIGSLADAAGVPLAIEAITEDLPAKRELLGQLQALLGPTAILASNTSSISITALASGVPAPGRVVGMHFFNPVPLMPLVEVVSGLHTEPEVAESIARLARRWGKVAVHARSTPGFIVNRIARPYYAEALALLFERTLEPQALDACLRAAGFRMGPCELMDLVGLDTNDAVTRSVFEAYCHDRRYAPSTLQRELVAGGLLGRKSGRGFYRYPEGAPPLPRPELAPLDADAPCTVHGAGAIARRLRAALAVRGIAAGDEPASAWTGLAVGGARLALTDGRCAYEVATACGHAEVAVFDRPLDLETAAGVRLAYAIDERASDGWKAQAPAWLDALGFVPQAVADSPGLVVARTVAMLINEGCDAVLQGVCTPAGADAAVKLGLHYPAGPFEWLARWDADEVIALVDALDRHYRGERYRASPWLRRHAAAQRPVAAANAGAR